MAMRGALDTAAVGQKAALGGAVAYLAEVGGLFWVRGKTPMRLP